MHPIEELIGEVKSFLIRLFTSLEKDKIDVSKYELDHICYRVETNKRYLELKREFAKYGELLTEAEINGRFISTFKLNEPINFGNRKIWCIELPSPKKGSPHPENYEHVEFVIDKSFETFMQTYPQIEFDTKAMNKPINPDIILRYDGFVVKFHHNTLEYIIKYLQ